MLDTKDEKYFNVKGVQINDPSINTDDVLLHGKHSPIHSISVPN
jgi:hypothetical protein